MKNILIVDDHKLIFDGISFSLKKYNPELNIYFAKDKNGTESLLKKYVFDIALIDLSLNGESGFDIAEIIKESVNYIFF